MLWCSVQRIRLRKSSMVMSSLARGWGEPARIVNGDPPNDGEPFAIYGQTWGAERLIPKARATGRPYWHIDNGYWMPGRGKRAGYYRICYRSMSPLYMPDADPARLRAAGITMKPWRRSGTHVLLALPGVDFGRGLGLDMRRWNADARAMVAAHTDRPIVVRERFCERPLGHDLEDAWAVVTYASNVAVQAAIEGIPVFVDAIAGAAPVGNLDLAVLEAPETPDRSAWLASLLCQQFTPAEMSNGTAFAYLREVRRRIDGEEPWSIGRPTMTPSMALSA